MRNELWLKKYLSYDNPVGAIVNVNIYVIDFTSGAKMWRNLKMSE